MDGLAVVMSDFGLFNPSWKQMLRERVVWCDENCHYLYVHDILSQNIRWQFVSDEDAIAFKLRWT